MSVRLRQTRIGSFDAFVLDNSSLQLTVAPELGGKLTSLIRNESGREYLLQPADPERAYRARSFGDRFENYGPCGFDECLPTVAACLYPEGPFAASKLPDHGDVWCLPSGIEAVGEKIRLTTSLKSLPLRFAKEVQLRGNTVRLDYEATNLSQSSVKFLWSAHPLLALEPVGEIILPDEVKEVEVGWSKDEQLGKAGDRCGWPKATGCSGRTVELNRVAPSSAGTAHKLFMGSFSEGFCGMFLPSKNETIAFRFDPRMVPYLGLWICQGGWPEDRADKQFTVALEPCSGRPDSLAEAIRRNECVMLAANQTARWWMEIELMAVRSDPPGCET